MCRWPYKYICIVYILYTNEEYADKWLITAVNVSMVVVFTEISLVDLTIYQNSLRIYITS